MAAGQWNGHNHGGTHTGDGKNRNGGPYSRNGKRFRKIPHGKFTEGKTVAYLGSHKNLIHKKGKVLSKLGDSFKSSRSTIKVDFGDKTVYVFKDNLGFV